MVVLAWKIHDYFINFLLFTYWIFFSLYFVGSSFDLITFHTTHTLSHTHTHFFSFFSHHFSSFILFYFIFFLFRGFSFFYFILFFPVCCFVEIYCFLSLSSLDFHQFSLHFLYLNLIFVTFFE